MSTTMDTYAELAPQGKLEAVSIYLDQIAEITLTVFTGIKIGCILNPGHGKIPAPDFNFYIQKDKYPI